MANTKIVQASGARKEAVARATIKPGKGIIKVNGQLLENFSNRMSRLRISEPLVLAEDIVKKTDVSVKVNGGGVNGQADAIRLSIARALVEFDNKLEKTFNDYDRLLLVADVRRKEVCKPNDSKARAKRQKSYR
jgi:small subunit ribosomal protein S9